MSGMEVLVPAIGLGFLWIISNQKKNDEGFHNLNRNLKLSGDQIIPQNFPIDDTKLNNVFKNKLKQHNVNQYQSDGDPTAKFYKRKFQQKQMNTQYKNDEFTTLTGETIKAKTLQHNNMVPWVKGKIRSLNKDVTESILDSYSGTGSQWNEKEARAPLFKPEKNLSWQCGMPNQNDFIQGRLNRSQKISGVKPFQPIHVGPGLDKGYGSAGNSGYNSGLDAREKWMPKSVDELRTLNNQKCTLPGNFGAPPQSSVKNIGIQPKMEKQRPDTFFENSPDRWFTTGGAEKAQTQRPEILLSYENRDDTSTSYFGAAKDTNEAAIYANRNYLPDHRQNLPTNPVGPVSRSQGWTGTKNDYGKDGYVSLPNSRSTTAEQSMGNVARGMWAVVTPVLDTLRPTRKTNIIGNVRSVGNPRGQYNTGLYNRHQEPKSTIKEQYVENRHVPYGGKYENRQYANKNSIFIKGQQRTSTQHEYKANVSSSSRYSQPRNYTNIKNQRNSNKDLLLASRANAGNMKLVNGTVNMVHRKEPLICAQPLRPANMPTSAPTIEAMGIQSNRPSKHTYCNDRTDSAMVSALANNPFNRSII